MKQTLLKVVLFIVFLSLFTACAGNEASVPEASPNSEEPVEQAASTTAPTELPEPTPVPEKSLVVCLGREPETLFLYGGASQSMWSVLESIYDGPFDTVDHIARPVILNSLPSVENGGVTFLPVSVEAGDIVVDAYGQLAQLADGVEVLPAGCTNPSCSVTWQSDQAVEMDQMMVQFELLEGLLWSDGAALTAFDSVFSYQIAIDPSMPISSYIPDRTSEYQAHSETEVSWVGIPGYFPRNVEDLFWIPLPKHQLEAYQPAALLTLPAAAATPLGWGAYVIEEWVTGDHITLRKNENYFRAEEGLPSFDRLVFRFPGESPIEYLHALQIGECDVVDRTASLSDIVHDVRVAELDGEVNLYLGQGPEWAQLMIGIQPSSYDDGYNYYQDDRPDFFSDPRIRRAFTACLNREKIISQFFFNMVTIPDSYVLPDHPLYWAEGEAQGYDPELGKSLLEEAGWKDFGGDARVSSGVVGVVDGTPLEINLALLESVMTLRNDDLIEYYTDDLEACGIKATPVLSNPMDMYAPGPEGRVFGRNFDLAEISWVAGEEPPCTLYLTDQIPTAENYWVGVNAGGFSNAMFDQACSLAQNTRLDDPETYENAHDRAQEIFMEELPAIPLYFHPQAAASRIDLCFFDMDVSSRSDLWNLEIWDISSDCIENIP